MCFSIFKKKSEDKKISVDNIDSSLSFVNETVEKLKKEIEPISKSKNNEFTINKKRPKKKKISKKSQSLKLMKFQ